MNYSAMKLEMDMATKKPTKEYIGSVTEELREFLLREVVEKGRTVASVYRDDIEKNKKWGAKFGEPLSISGVRYHLREAMKAKGHNTNMVARAKLGTVPASLNAEQKLLQVRSALDMDVDSDTILKFIRTVLSG